MGFGVIRIVNDHGVSLGDCLGPLSFLEEYPRFRIVRGRIVRLRNDGAPGPIIGARDVAFRIVAMEKFRPIDQSLREANHRRDKLGINGERALEKTDCGVIA